MGKEIELKLDLTPATAALLRREAKPAGARKTSGKLTSVYYDTKKRSLSEQGFSFRVRNDGKGSIQTLKRSSASGGLLSRDEWEWRLDGDQLDLSKLDELGDPLPFDTAKIGPKLHPVMRSEIERTSWLLRQGESQLRADLDVGKIAADSRSIDLAELEFELVDGGAADVIEAARDIAERHPARLGVLSKAERGFALARGSLARVSKTGSVPVDGSMNVADALAAIGHSCLKHFRLNEDLVLRTRDVEALHQTRVAMRRLRSALSFFRPAIKDEEAPRLRNELRWLAGQLGEARNLDVYLLRDLDKTERKRSEQLREEAYDRMIAAMESARFRTLPIEIAGWLSCGMWRSGKRAQKPVTEFAGQRFDKLWGTIEPTGRSVVEMSEEARHELRIKVKKMRYAVEFLEGAYPASRSKKRFTVVVEELQEILGELNDL